MIQLQEKFYIDMLQHNNKCKNILTTRVCNICHKYNIDVMRLLFYPSCMTSVKNEFVNYPKHGQDGLSQGLIYIPEVQKRYLCYNSLLKFV